MFRSNRDIEVYLREWRELGEFSQRQALESLDTENTVLLVQYVKRGYVYRKQRRHWELLTENIDDKIPPTLLWRKTIEQQLYGKCLTLDTGKRRREYETCLERLERMRKILLNEAMCRDERIDELWNTLARQLLFTREIGERMTWLKQTNEHMMDLLHQDIYSRPPMAQEHFPGDEELAGIAPDAFSWIDVVQRANKVLNTIYGYMAMEEKSMEEILSKAVEMAVYVHKNCKSWFVENGFAEDEIPSLEEWMDHEGSLNPAKEKLLAGPSIKEAYVKKLFFMEEDDSETWGDDPTTYEWFSSLWTTDEFYADPQDMVAGDGKGPIPEKKPRLHLVEPGKED